MSRQACATSPATDCIRVGEQSRAPAVVTKAKTNKKSSKRPDQGPLATEFRRSRALRIVAVIAIVAVAGWILAGLFAPGPRYSLTSLPAVPAESEAFLEQVAPLVDSAITRNNRIEPLRNGEQFYQAEFTALRQAQHNIEIEAYILHKGEITRRLLDILTERARAGVQVRLTLDSLGSVSTPKSYFKALRQAGGRVEWYHSLRWDNWFMSNNRTHREMTIVDGTTAFVGGAGYADWWRYPSKHDPSWRDTVFRIDGEAVTRLQGVFVENWLESSGEVLNGEQYFPRAPLNNGRTAALVVASTPSSGGSTRSRILFQMLIGAARKSIDITTPYFVPDSSMRREMVRALGRGVRVRIIVPGNHTDHYLTRSTGRRLFGELLKAGAQIYEYEPSMIHAKIMVADGAWVVFGSTNLDNRSFGINDEVNVAALDSELGAVLTHQFDEDLSHSDEITLQHWSKRSVFERLFEWLGDIVARQQ
jgi:cardiolipin synthase